MSVAPPGVCAPRAARALATAALLGAFSIPIGVEDGPEACEPRRHTSHMASDTTRGTGFLGAALQRSPNDVCHDACVAPGPARGRAACGTDAQFAIMCERRVWACRVTVYGHGARGRLASCARLDVDMDVDHVAGNAVRRV